MHRFGGLGGISGTSGAGVVTGGGVTETTISTCFARPVPAIARNDTKYDTPGVPDASINDTVLPDRIAVSSRISGKSSATSSGSLVNG